MTAGECECSVREFAVPESFEDSRHFNQVVSEIAREEWACRFTLIHWVRPGPSALIVKVDPGPLLPPS